MTYCVDTPELQSEPDLDRVLDHGWDVLCGVTPEALPGFGWEEDPDSMHQPAGSEPNLFRTKAWVYDVVETLVADSATRNGRYIKLLVTALDLPSEFIDCQLQGFLVGDRPSDFHLNELREDATWALGVTDLGVAQMRKFQVRTRKARDEYSIRFLREPVLEITPRSDFVS
ncbi:MAG: hypothetical protein AAGE52_21100 [Myxococcota bacterium]